MRDPEIRFVRITYGIFSTLFAAVTFLVVQKNVPPYGWIEVAIIASMFFAAAFFGFVAFFEGRKRMQKYESYIPSHEISIVVVVVALVLSEMYDFFRKKFGRT